MGEGNPDGAAAEEVEQILMARREVHTMRQRLHELSNIFTGVMIAGGLLTQNLAEESLSGYVRDICEGSERGSHLVREMRSQLMAVCGETEFKGRPPG